MSLHSQYGLVNAPLLAGVERLWNHLQQNGGLTINGATVQPSLFMAASDIVGSDGSATWADRIAAVTYTVEGPHVVYPEVGNPAPHLQDLATKTFDARDYFAAASAYCDLTTNEDAIWLALVRVEDNQTTCFGKIAAGPTVGWNVGVYADLLRTVSIIDTSSNISRAWVPAQYDKWGVAFGAINRSESTIATGTLATWNDSSSGIGRSGAPNSVGSLSNSVKTAIGTGEAGTGFALGTMDLALCAVWSQVDWFSAGATGITEMEAASKLLNSLIFGTTPLHTHGPDTPESF